MNWWNQSRCLLSTQVPVSRLWHVQTARSTSPCCRRLTVHAAPGVRLDTVARPLLIRELEAIAAGDIALDTLAPQIHASLTGRLELAAAQLRGLPHGLHMRKPIKRLRKKYEACLSQLGPEKEVGDGSITTIAASAREGFAFGGVDRIDETIQILPSKDADAELRGVAQGVFEVARKFGKSDNTESYFGSETQQEIDGALADFNRTRIGIRLLADSWQTARDSSSMGRPRSRRQRGTVQPHCCLVREACAAASYASEICNENLYACPEIIIEPPSTESEADPLVVSYVPNHIWYTMVELLKNACLASLLAHSRPGQAWTQIKTGGVRVSFASSVEEGVTTITVADDGMGLADEELAFSYTYTGWKARPDQKWGLDLAGAGVGLPTVRQYARYFGGDLTYKRVQGEGNDQALSQMCLQLRHLPSAVEQL